MMTNIAVNIFIVSKIPVSMFIVTNTANMNMIILTNIATNM